MHTLQPSLPHTKLVNSDAMQLHLKPWVWLRLNLSTATIDRHRILRLCPAHDKVPLEEGIPAHAGRVLRGGARPRRYDDVPVQLPRRGTGTTRYALPSNRRLNYCSHAYPPKIAHVSKQSLHSTCAAFMLILGMTAVLIAYVNPNPRLTLTLEVCYRSRSA